MIKHLNNSFLWGIIQLLYYNRQFKGVTMPNERLSEDEILAIIKSRYADSDSAMQTVKREREQSLKYYKQELYGDEQEGRSTFITSDVRDTIEWILPNLVEMFIGGDNPVVFKPRNSNDIESAQQESDYVRYVINDQNQGFLNTYQWFKDALISKNGIIKTYWDDSEVEIKEEYENQSFGEYAELLKDDDITINKIEVYIKEDKKRKEIAKYKSTEEINEAISNMKLDIRNPEMTFDVYAVRNENRSQVKEYVVAPELFFVDHTLTSLDLDEAGFLREDFYLTESDLREMGIEQDVIDMLPSNGATIFSDSERQERYRSAGGVPETLSMTDKSTRLIKVSDIYIKLDVDGDGTAELMFIKLGADDVILEMEEVDSQPYSAITPNIMTHCFFGMSVADMVADLQKLHTTLMRQSLDSLYLANNPRTVVARGAVELDDLLTSRPGGIIRADSIDSLREYNTTFVGQNAFPMMDRVEKMREQRTGVSQTTQGLDPSALADATNMVGVSIMSAAQQRIKMIARIFAETGFKQRISKVHELVLKHESNEKIFDLNDGFVTVKPSTWRSRRDFKIQVGVGYAEKRERIVAIERMLNAQREIFAAQGGMNGPLVSVSNIYNALQDLQELTGIDSRNRYISNPDEYVPPPEPVSAQSEALEIAEAEVTLKATQAAAEYELDVQKHFDDMSIKQQQLANDRAKIFIEAKSVQDDQDLKILFKDADMRQRDIEQQRKVFFDLMRRGTNVQNEQKGLGAVAGGQGYTAESGL